MKAAIPRTIFKALTMITCLAAEKPPVNNQTP
jgi:hypothetical protein